MRIFSRLFKSRDKPRNSYDSVPATVTSSGVPTVVSESMTGNVSSVIDNFTFCIVEGEVGGYEKHSFKN